MAKFLQVFFWGFLWSTSILASTLPGDPTLFTYAYKGSVYPFGLNDLVSILVPFVAATWIERLYPLALQNVKD